MPGRKTRQVATLEFYSELFQSDDGAEPASAAAHDPGAISVFLLLEELHIPYQRRAPVPRPDDPVSGQVRDAVPPLLFDPAGPNGAGLSLHDASATLLYLARKSGRFYSRSGRRRIELEECLFWQCKGIVMSVRQIRLLAQHLHPEGLAAGGAADPADFRAHPCSALWDCLFAALGREYEKIEARLAHHSYLADTYSIADMALWPWLRPEYRYGPGNGLALDPDFPRLQDWYERIEHRPTVKRAMAALTGE